MPAPASATSPPRCRRHRTSWKSPRTLSDNAGNTTRLATDEISSQIAGMQTATQQAVGSIKMIYSTIGKISEIARAISSAIEEQDAATQEISGNIQRTTAGTSQVAGTIAEVSHGADRTGAAPNQLLSSAKQLSDSTASLQAEIDGFLKSIAAAAQRRCAEPGAADQKTKCSVAWPAAYLANRGGRSTSGTPMSALAWNGAETSAPQDQLKRSAGDSYA